MFKKFLSLLVVCSLGLVGMAEAEEKQVPPDHAEKMAAGLKIFKQQVRGILIKSCLHCHGGESTESSFNLATRDGLLKGGDYQVPGVVPGNAKESWLYRLITHQTEPTMPQEASKLKPAEIAAVAAWINHGAPYDKPLIDPQAERIPWTERKVPAEAKEYWAFQPLNVVDPPEVKNAAWVRNPIDRFVLNRLEAQGMQPNSTAEPRTLLRRLSFDLIGLPPSVEEIEKFTENPTDEVYKELVDLLLDKPGFGERWARHWLDVARFAESHGFEQDYDRPHAYHYRDFVIKAFNSDMPYDQFVQWQLAGDEFAPDEPLAMMATGFLGAGVYPTQITLREVEPSRYDALDDMANTTGQAFLGLTIGCARCHDHKFDPIPQADYYRFTSTFTTTVRSNIELALDPDSDKKTKVMVASEGVKPIRHHMPAGAPDFYEDFYYLKRGDTQQKAGKAKQGFLQALTAQGMQAKDWQELPPDGVKTSYRRRSLANWMVDTEHGAGHLLARVIVNRLWHHHFGQGIVLTPNDFGKQAEAPSHPELLDYLAKELIEHDWSLKHLHRLIVTSATYRQSSEYDKQDFLKDTRNRLLWRFAPRRLEAEAIRDSILAVTGTLDRNMYGPGTLNENMNRRSIYFMVKRSKLIPSMTLFDAPEPLVPIGRRSSTTIGPQALWFLNNPQIRSSATAFAKSVDAKLSSKEKIQQIYQRALGRLPDEKELHLSLTFLKQQTDSYQESKQSNPEQLALADFCQSVLSLNEFIYLY